MTGHFSNFRGGKINTREKPPVIFQEVSDVKLGECYPLSGKSKKNSFDPVRVQYRYERRAIIREIILQCLVGEVMQQFIRQEAQKIPEVSRKDFLGDIAEDLELINEIRIVGLGVTPEQLRWWMDQSSKSSPK